MLDSVFSFLSQDGLVRFVVAVVSATVSVITLIITGRQQVRRFRYAEDAQTDRLRKLALDTAERFDAQSKAAWTNLDAEVADARERYRKDLQREIDNCAHDAERFINEEAARAAKAAEDALRNEVDERSADGGVAAPRIEIAPPSVVIRAPQVVWAADQLNLVEPSSLAPSLHIPSQHPAGSQKVVANTGAGLIAAGALAAIIAVPTMPVAILALAASGASLLIARAVNKKDTK